VVLEVVLLVALLMELVLQGALERPGKVLLAEAE
jgi:hypothetical protein